MTNKEKCEHCGKELTEDDNYLEEDEGTFCSNLCYDNYLEDMEDNEKEDEEE